MGQRANYIIVGEDDFELYYSHYGANAVEQDFFWGPGHALQFVRSQERCDPRTDWLTDQWCEGGALIDAARKILIWFGGNEDISYEPDLRSTLLDLMQFTWPGWEIRQAYQEITDFAEYVGYDPKALQVVEHFDGGDLERAKKAHPLVPERDSPGRVSSVLSLGRADEPAIYIVRNWFPSLFIRGPALIPELEAIEPCESYSFPESDFPMLAMHMDPEQLLLRIWLFNTIPNLKSRLRKIWPGWQIEFNGADYAGHQEVCQGRVRYGERGLEKKLSMLRHILLRTRQDPVGSLPDLLSALRSRYNEVEISPAAFAHVHREVPFDEREAIFGRAVLSYLDHSP